MPRRVGHSSGHLKSLPEWPAKLESQWNKTEQNGTVFGVSKKTRFRHCSLNMMGMSHVILWKLAVYAHTSKKPKIAFVIKVCGCLLHPGSRRRCNCELSGTCRVTQSRADICSPAWSSLTPAHSHLPGGIAARLNEALGFSPTPTEGESRHSC